ncbi:MAG: response regulator [Gemmatimonadota bacterium]
MSVDHVGEAVPEPVEILLVEDNPDDADLTMRAFARQKLTNRVVWVKDGAEALDFLFATGEYANRNGAAQPRVVLLDLKLPKIDGIEVLRRIRANEATATLPVVVLTSSTQDIDRDAAWREGTNSFVCKPVEFAEFQRVVTELGMYWALINRPPIATALTVPA